ATGLLLHGYDRLDDGVRIRRQVHFASGNVEISETLRVHSVAGNRRLLREVNCGGISTGWVLDLNSRIPKGMDVDVVATIGGAKAAATAGNFTARLFPNRDRAVAAVIHYDELPRAKEPPATERPAILADPGRIEGSLERPGYRAIALPRPKTIAGDDLIMPGA